MSAKKILCIDIGGTRIKSAVLPEEPSLDDIRTAPSTVIQTMGWLNHSLPQLVDPGHWPGLASYYSRQDISYDEVSISVPGVVDSNGVFHRNDLTNWRHRVPKQLLDAFEKTAGCQVTLTKDADAWMYGLQQYTTLSGINIEYPLLLLTLGTGLGISVAAAPDSIISIEATNRPASSWRLLPEAARYPILFSWQVHRLIGRPFFQHVERWHPKWSYLKTRDLFTKRVNAALKDILPWIEEKAGSSIKTIALAGGNAEYVSVRNFSDSGRTIIPLTNGKTLLPPDLITVLGVEAATRRPRPVQS